MIQALVLDFDGLILDTETAVFESWRRTWEHHGEVLPLDRWHERHRHDPPLANAAGMLEALSLQFEVVNREPCAYLYWYALRVLDSRPDGREIGERLIDLERRLIAAGRIRPVGLRIVALRRRSNHP